jgi:hypothetical protein
MALGASDAVVANGTLGQCGITKINARWDRYIPGMMADGKLHSAA